MKILIVEDDKDCLQLLQTHIMSKLNKNSDSLHSVEDLPSAQIYLIENQIDLMFLDLNLHGENGFELLKSSASQSYHTIVVSADKDKAYTAFQYGVLDFIAKPFNKTRVFDALDQYLRGNAKAKMHLKYIGVHKKAHTELLDISQIHCINAQTKTSQIFTNDNEAHTSKKSISNLEKILPKNFIRIHKSWIINMNCVKSLRSEPGSKYSIILMNGACAPVSRKKYAELKKNLQIA